MAKTGVSQSQHMSGTEPTIAHAGGISSTTVESLSD
jgi:hypothetical protein